MMLPPDKRAGSSGDKGETRQSAPLAGLGLQGQLCQPAGLVLGETQVRLLFFYHKELRNVCFHFVTCDLTSTPSNYPLSLRKVEAPQRVADRWVLPAWERKAGL